jgi:16S rRNA (cytosine967-C5)-methyltransferase
MIVDFCAGAGGKSLALGALMRSTGRVYAFDVSERRLAKLGPRLARSGLSNIHPQRIASERDPKVKRLSGKIDRVLVDAPCTGLGTLRRNPDLKWRQTANSASELSAKQAGILAAAAGLVKRGGRLLYATCSILSEENERVVQAFLAGHPGFALVAPAAALAAARIELPGHAPGEEFLRLRPDVHATDAFFGALMERR